MNFQPKRACAYAGFLFSILMTGSFAHAQEMRPLRLREFAIPSYPPIARYAGREGSVNADISLDSNCTVSGVQVGGDLLFAESVKEAIALWKFDKCAPGQRTGHAHFEFRMGGDANEWSPTFFEMKQPLDFVITTSRPELQFQK